MLVHEPSKAFNFRRSLSSLREVCCMIGDSWIVPSSASSVGGLTLHCVSTVATDSAFKVSVNQATRDSAYSQHGGGRGFLAIRTTNGRGQVDLSSNHQLDVGANSLLIIDWSSLLGYRCLGGHWFRYPGRSDQRDSRRSF